MPEQMPKMPRLRSSASVRDNLLNNPRENARRNGKAATVYRGVRIKFSERRELLVIRHQTGTRTSPRGMNLGPGKKYAGIVVDRGILHSCVEAITRAPRYRSSVAFTRRQLSAEGKGSRRGIRRSRRDGRGAEKKKEGSLFHHHGKLEAKDRI